MTRTAKLLDLKLADAGTDLDEFVSVRRADGKPWATITDELHDTTGERLGKNWLSRRYPAA